MTACNAMGANMALDGAVTNGQLYKVLLSKTHSTPIKSAWIASDTVVHADGSITSGHSNTEQHAAACWRQSMQLHQFRLTANNVNYDGESPLLLTLSNVKDAFSIFQTPFHLQTKALGYVETHTVTISDLSVTNSPSSDSIVYARKLLQEKPVISMPFEAITGETITAELQQPYNTCRRIVLFNSTTLRTGPSTIKYTWRYRSSGLMSSWTTVPGNGTSIDLSIPTPGAYTIAITVENGVSDKMHVELQEARNISSDVLSCFTLQIFIMALSGLAFDLVFPYGRDSSTMIPPALTYALVIAVEAMTGEIYYTNGVFCKRFQRFKFSLQALSMST